MVKISALDFIEATRVMLYWGEHPEIDSQEKRKELREASDIIAYYHKQNPPKAKGARYTAKRYRELWEQAEDKIAHLESLIEYLEKDAEILFKIREWYNAQA